MGRIVSPLPLVVKMFITVEFLRELLIKHNKAVTVILQPTRTVSASIISWLVITIDL